MSHLLLPKSPTEEQQAVLDSPHRVTVVRACPGAGKTEVFVEAIRRKLEKWPDIPGGLAALSFTNIARDTIEARVGSAVTAPHFVGTLDAFAFRFVVKPFGHLVGLPAGAVRLFPAVLCDQLDHPSVQVGSVPSARATLYDVHFIGWDGKHAIMRADVAVSAGMTRQVAVSPDRLKIIWDQKRDFWKKTGIITHSDCHFLAWWILIHKTHGAAVRQLLLKRFPVIFIDELQDTGSCLAKAFLALFGEPGMSGLVVGDPNQAIYGFGGASPTVFSDFEALSGAVPFTIKLSQRCPKSVAQVATALSASGVPVEPLPGAVQGSVMLLVHSLADTKLTQTQAKIIRDLQLGAELAVITRKTATARALRGTVVRDEFKGKSGAARKVNIAVQRLLSGEPREAAQIVERELCRVVLGNDRAGQEAIEKLKISRGQWRAAVFSILLAGVRKVKGETWNQWTERMKRAVRASAASVGWTGNDKALRAYMKCAAKGEELRGVLLDVPVAPLWGSADNVSTIHKVKGAEFDTVMLFVPKPTKNQCPSVQWWAGGDAEEQRIAFVAASRAKQRLILCVHSETHAALMKTRPEFIGLFQETLALPVA